jgi:hypothetical protein
MHRPGIAVAALAATLVASAAAPAPGADLVGTWHVLIHYRDDQAHNKDAVRWDDRIWVFAREGDRLRWTEYPIVVFSDRRGRFESGGAGMVRVVHAWEPTTNQVQQIRGGLDINERGAKSKTLRRSNAKGWRSSGRATTASASIVTYHETWSIDDPTGLPVFTRDDALGSGVAEDYDGRTQYTTTESAPDGSVLRGSFERDGTRHGIFRMMRAGDVGIAESQAGRDQREGRRSMFMARFMSAAADSPEFQAEIRAEVEKSFRERGVDPADHPEQVAASTAAVTEEVREGIRSGRSQDEIRAKIAERSIRDLTESPEFRAQIRAEVEERFRREALRPEDYETEVERVTDIVVEVSAEGLRKGRSRASIDREIEERLQRELRSLAP